MKKIFIVFCIFMSAFIFFEVGQARLAPIHTYKLFFVDRQMHRLVPTNFETTQNNTSKIAREIISNLVEGRDFNSQILRIIPNEKDYISVKVKKDTVIVDLSSKMRGLLSKNAETEQLVIYQIVNSLTSVPQINFVKFTIDGKTQEDFLGFLDMRETFKSNYRI